MGQGDYGDNAQAPRQDDEALPKLIPIRFVEGEILPPREKRLPLLRRVALTLRIDKSNAPAGETESRRRYRRLVKPGGVARVVSDRDCSASTRPSRAR
jgi:hypothetical protein